MSPEIDSVFLEEKLAAYGYRDLLDIRVSFDTYKYHDLTLYHEKNTIRNSSLSDLVRKCLRMNPACRPNAKQLLGSRYFGLLAQPH